jgi:RNA polymerase sigma-70 factor (ECF subfamily)
MATMPIPLRVSDAIGDPELVARALDGDRWSREVIYRRHAPSLLGMAIRLTSNRHEAEEIVQETFVTGFEQLHTLREPAALRAWLGQIAVRLVHGAVRKRRFLRVLGLDRGADDATMASLAAPDVPGEQRAELALLDRVLGKLRAPIRIAWMLRRVEGLELTEVASMTDCSLATVKRRIAEAEALIKRHVALPDSEMEETR